MNRREFIKASAGLLASASLAPSRLLAGGMPFDKPNVVIIYGDDVGFGDVGVYGARKIPTPNIDKLAESGLRFTDGHCTAATCTPSRYSLLTGVHGFRHGIRILSPDAPLTIPQDSMTLPRVFRKERSFL